jgi:hypothetical protein
LGPGLTFSGINANLRVAQSLILEAIEALKNERDSNPR